MEHMMDADAMAAWADVATAAGLQVGKDKS
jgi:hypothetical protein